VVGGEQLALIGMILGGIAGVLFAIIWVGYGAFILFFATQAWRGAGSTP
jgi:hypothetical protein